MPHWVPAVLALAVLLIVALAVAWIHAELDGRQCRRTISALAVQVRHHREQAAKLRAELDQVRRDQLADAALNPTADHPAYSVDWAAQLDQIQHLPTIDDNRRNTR